MQRFPKRFAIAAIEPFAIDQAGRALGPVSSRIDAVAAGAIVLEDGLGAALGGAAGGEAGPGSRSPTAPEEALVLLGDRILPVGPEAWSVREGQFLIRVEAGADPALGALVVGREDALPLGILGLEEDGRYPLLPLPAGGE